MVSVGGGGKFIQPSCNGFYLVLLGFYRVLPNFTEFYRVLLGFTEFYWVLPSFIEFYWVIPSFTGFYWA